MGLERRFRRVWPRSLQEPTPGQRFLGSKSSMWYALDILLFSNPSNHPGDRIQHARIQQL